MKLKIIMLMTVLSAGLNTMIFAQGDGGFSKRTPKEIAQMRTEKMTENLGLSADQKAWVMKINLNSAQKMKGINRMDRIAYKTLQKDNEDQFKKILTEDQFQKYQSIQKERMDRMNNRKGSNGE